MRLVTCLLGAVLITQAAEPGAQTLAAFNQYVQQFESNLSKHQSPADFLWLDAHPKEKSLVWLNQSQVTQNKIEEVPGGLLQDWIGDIFLPAATLDRVRDMLLDYANHKVFFKAYVTESRLVKREDGRFDSYFRIQRRQLLSVALDVTQSAEVKALDPSRAVIVCRSTRISEAKGKPPKQGVPEPGEESGYLWRMNQYWRLQQADNGVYAELELISVSQPSGMLKPDRILRGPQSLPRGFVEALIEGLHAAFPPNHR